MRKLSAEFLGTFLLVFGGCGSALFSAAFPAVGIGLHGVALAFGLTVVAGAYAFGPISGGHFNPAVSLGLAAAGRFSWSEVPRYVGAQCAGAIVASATLRILLSQRPGGIGEAATLAANGFGDHSPAHYSLLAALLGEAILTFLFVAVILGATSKSNPAPALAGLAIGLCLTLVHLIGIPLTNLSVNPARSAGPALLAGGAALEQLWLFWLAPVAGAVSAGALGRWLFAEERAPSAVPQS